jgi:hypothetical protein
MPLLFKKEFCQALDQAFVCMALFLQKKKSLYFAKGCIEDRIWLNDSKDQILIVM